MEANNNSANNNLLNGLPPVIQKLVMSHMDNQSLSTVRGVNSKTKEAVEKAKVWDQRKEAAAWNKIYKSVVKKLGRVQLNEAQSLLNVGNRPVDKALNSLEQLIGTNNEGQNNDKIRALFKEYYEGRHDFQGAFQKVLDEKGIK